MYDNVLVSTDGSAVANKGVETAVGIARQNDAVLHVIHVVDADSLPSSVSSIRMGDEFEELGQSIVDHARERAEGAGIDVDTTVVSGNTSEEILDYLDTHDVDLVVMGTHGRHGINRMLLGSVTERVVRESPVPVLTVRLTEGDEGKYDHLKEVE